MTKEIPGYVIQRRLEDGRVVAVAPMSYGKGRLILGDDLYVHDAWCYESVATAIVALDEWNPDRAEEPSGWFRHPATGRRRPEGDPSKEYVRP